jgi:ATP-binding cassette subfamily B protein RaxB
MGYFEKRHIGDIVSRFGSLSAIQSLFTTGLVEAVLDGLMAVTVFIMMYLYSPSLTMLILAVTVISFIIHLFFYYPNRRLTAESIIASASEETAFLESIHSVQTIKLFNHESNRENLWLNRFSDVVNLNITKGRLGLWEGGIIGIISGLEGILVVYFGALSVLEQQLTVGMLLAFMAYKAQFSSSISGLISKIFSFMMLSLHLERLSDITLEEKEEDHQETGLSLSKEIRGELVLKDICFRYSENSVEVLNNINLHIKSGESIALVGPSGCGKTTLMKIILGLLKPTSGTMYLDGVDVSHLSLSEYRKYFGAVMQDDTLMSGTVLENLTLFEPGVDTDVLRECCRLACILDDIEALPMGFHALVGDMGNSFSGGQLQRLFLARALYKAPTILCLDEATSHLDQQNEALVNTHINSLNLTRIIIAHRQETIDSVERIAYL